MPVTTEAADNAVDKTANGDQWPGIDSRYRLIIVAALRSKQLLRGAPSRIAADPLKRRNTSIALEEVKRGLVPFSIAGKDPEQGNGSEAEPDARPGEVMSHA